MSKFETNSNDFLLEKMRGIGAGSGITELEKMMLHDDLPTRFFAQLLDQLLQSRLATSEQVGLLLNRLEIFPDKAQRVMDSRNALLSKLTGCSGDLQRAAEVTRAHLEGLIAEFSTGYIDEYDRFVSLELDQHPDYVRNGYALV